MTRCPACDAILFRRRAGGLEVDGCASCGGLWLDKGELRGLLQRPEARIAVNAAVRPGIQPPTGVAGRRACPRCETALTRGRFPAAREVELDGCQTCGGVWLDAGELEAIARQVSPEPVNVPAPAAGPWASPPPPADPTRTAALPVVRRDLLPTLPAPSGFFDGIAKGITLVGATFRMAKECPALLWPAAIGAVLDLALGAALIAGLLWLHGNGYLESAGEGGEGASGFRGWMAGAGIGVLFVFRFIHVVVSGMTVSSVDAFLKGRPPSLKTAFRDVLQNLGGLFTLAVVATLVELLLSFLRGSRRRSRGLAGAALAAVGAGLAAAIEAAWTVLSFLLLPVIIVEDVGLGTALRRVRDLHRRNIVAAAAGHVGIRTLMGLVGLAVFAAVGALAFLVWPPSLGQLITLAAVFLFALTAVGLVRAYATGAYYTFMYLWAAEVEREGAAEALPATFRPAWS